MKHTAVLLGVTLLCGCASWSSNSGVENLWRTESAPVWIPGKTTEDDVARTFGPPSQVIGLQKRTVFYYLREEQRGKGAIFLLFNWGENNTVYDRAIFFFDEAGLLTNYAYSHEALPHDSE